MTPALCLPLSVALDLASTMGSLDPDRRHSITVCESPNKMHAAEVAPPPGPQRHPSADYPLGLLGGVSVAGVMGGTNAVSMGDGRCRLTVSGQRGDGFDAGCNRVQMSLCGFSTFIPVSCS